MNPKAKSQFRVVDGEREHPRDRARREVRRWRSDAEKQRLPVTTLTGERPLDVDGVLAKTLRSDTAVARRKWWQRWWR